MAGPYLASAVSAREPGTSWNLYKHWAIISAATLLGFGILLGFCRMVRNWGWWRVSSAKYRDVEVAGTSYHRARYKRTWHGWVRREYEPEQHHPGLKQRSPFQERLLSAAARQHYNRIFWRPDAGPPDASLDPLTRVKQRPRWYRCLHGLRWTKSNPMDEEAAPVLDTPSLFPRNQGLLQPLPRARKSNDHRTADRALIGTGADGGLEGGTIRRRRLSASAPAAWVHGSEETTRALMSQLFLPRTRHTGPDPPNSECSWEAGDVEAQVPSRRRTSVPGRLLASVTWPLTRAVQSMNGMQCRSPRLPLYNTPQDTGCSALPSRRSSGLTSIEILDSACQVPHNSEDVATPRGFTPASGAIAARLRRKPYDNRTQAGSLEAGPSPEIQFVQGLTRQLELWKDPVLVDPHPRRDLDKALEGSGIAARPTSPAMGWIALSDAPESYYEDLKAYEAESEHDGEVPAPTSSDTQSFRTAASEIRSVSDGPPAEPQRTLFTYLESKGVGPLGTRGGRWYSAHREELSRRPSSFLCPRRGASMPMLGGVAETPRPDRTLLPSVVVTEESQKVTMTPGSQHPKKATVMSQKTFVSELDRKLSWLDHELSPGGRGIGLSPYERDKGPIDHSMAQAVGGLMQFMAPGLPRQDVMRRRAHNKRRIRTPRVDSWRQAVNQLRRTRRRSGPMDLLVAIAQYKESARQGVPPQEIDTSAWIIRRPPQGQPSLQMKEAAEDEMPTRGKKLTKIRLVQQQRRNVRPKMLRWTTFASDFNQGPVRGRRKTVRSANEGLPRVSAGEVGERRVTIRWDDELPTVTRPDRRAISRGRNPFQSIIGNAQSPRAVGRKVLRSLSWGEGQENDRMGRQSKRNAGGDVQDGSGHARGGSEFLMTGALV
ncbi:MAG: hypothetical protein M1817_004638 [Caeruleum heppii]|nr:MAG: hypothetical protein M1817_004638 [Caeruleum heppii]